MLFGPFGHDLLFGPFGHDLLAPLDPCVTSVSGVCGIGLRDSIDEEGGGGAHSDVFDAEGDVELGLSGGDVAGGGGG